MSGGFFRGTSADQDTRFSNKEAKLLKSQKFAPELEHQVDMSRVKMDVIRPWIATRVTELLGFEDEVLINFIYGLLDGKDVDGKQIQIQLTGFMEKNTAKFMKELWALLRSAQNNVSGVPQQFLDAKEEETRKKKAETDRIAQEIQRRKEKDGREFEREKFSRMDGEDDIARSGKGASDLASKHSNARVSGFQPEEEREADGRLDSKARNGHSKSPKSDDNSPSPSRSTPSSIREGRSRSRSASVSSQSQRHSVSPPRQYQSPARRSLTPRRRYRSSPHHSISPRRRHSPRKPRSPSRRRSPYIRRRSNSRSRHRSPSPIRQRSPRVRRRSPPFIRRRSPSPLRRRSSPLRRRSRSPLRRRSPSPLRRRSPIKVHRRSPSPVRRRSPIRYKSPSPVRRRSPPPRSPKQQRQSPLHSPKGRLADSQNSPRLRNRSHSPDRSRSPLHRTRKSLSREHDDRSDGIESRRHRDILTTQRKRERRSPLHHALEREPTENHDAGLKVLDKVAHKVQISLRSPQRDVKKQSDVRGRVPVPSDKSPIQSESPNNVQRTNPKISRRSRSLSKSPVRQTRERASHYDSPEASAEEKQSREASHQISDSSRKTSKELSQNARLKISNAHDRSPELKSRDKLAVDQSPAVRGHRDNSGLGKKDSGRKRDMDLRERHVRQLSHSSEEREYGPGKTREGRASLGNEHDRHLSAKQLSRNKSSAEEKEPMEQTDGHRGLEHETERRIQSKKKVVDKDQFDSDNSDSEETDTSKYHKIQNVEKRKHKKSDKRRRDSDESSGSDSQMDDRKEAKRRKKDEKRLRKEERRRRREERHRRRLERRTSKLKVKSVDTVTPPSDFEKNHSNADDSDADATIRKNSHPNDPDETESEQKKLEIELRKKALESLRAKKAISH